MAGLEGIHCILHKGHSYEVKKDGSIDNHDLSCSRFGTSKEQFAKVAEKNHRHSANNPYAQFQDVYSLQEILDSKEICDPLTVSST